MTTTNTVEYNTYSSIDEPPLDTTTSWKISVQSFILVMGLIGMLSNAFVITIFACSVKKSSQRKSTTNVLILNLLSIDMYSCVCLVVTYAFKLTDTDLEESTEDSVITCMLLDSEMLLWFGLNSSPTSLFFIAAERYSKIVHPILHRKYCRSWMTYLSIAIAWINGILLTAPVTVITTTFTGRKCEAYSTWPNASQHISFGIFYFLWDYLLPSLTFVYCYWHIGSVIRDRVKGPLHLVVIKRNRDNNGAHASLGAQAQIAGIQTVVIITLAFIVCWLPNQIYFLLMHLCNNDLNQLSHAWYGTLAFASVTCCVQPFIYSGKISRRWKRLTGCLGTSQAVVHPARNAHVDEYNGRPVSIISIDQLNVNPTLELT